MLCCLLFIVFLVSMACRNLLPSRYGGIRFGIPLQKLHPLSRAIHHRYSANATPQRPPHRHYTSLSRLPVRPPRSRSGHGYQQQRSFWVARLAARLLKLRYILLGSAVGGGYTAKKVKPRFNAHKGVNAYGLCVSHVASFTSKCVHHIQRKRYPPSTAYIRSYKLTNVLCH